MWITTGTPSSLGSLGCYSIVGPCPLSNKRPLLRVSLTLTTLIAHTYTHITIHSMDTYLMCISVSISHLLTQFFNVAPVILNPQDKLLTLHHVRNFVFNHSCVREKGAAWNRSFSFPPCCGSSGLMVSIITFTLVGITGSYIAGD